MRAPTPVGEEAQEHPVFVKRGGIVDVRYREAVSDLQAGHPVVAHKLDMLADLKRHGSGIASRARSVP